MTAERSDAVAERVAEPITKSRVPAECTEATAELITKLTMKSVWTVTEPVRAVREASGMHAVSDTRAHSTGELAAANMTTAEASGSAE